MMVRGAAPRVIQRWGAALVALLAVSALADGHAAAEPGSFSLPLMSPDLPDGVLTVKVVGSGMEDLKVDVPVTLAPAAGQAGATAPVTAQTGEDGRARFDTLKPGLQYMVSVVVDEHTHTSAPFQAPAQGGVRLLLSLRSPAQGEAHPSVPSGMPPGAPTGGMPPQMPPGAAGGMPPQMPPGAAGGMPPQMPPRAAGEMPPGMPGAPSPQQLPPGHPPVPEDGGAAAGRGGPGGQSVQVKPAPELEPRQVEVVVSRGSENGPRSGVPVRLPGAQQPLGTTDAQGRLTVSIPETVGPQVVLAVEHDGVEYQSQPTPLPAEGGVQMTFTVYDRTTKLDGLVLATGSHLVLQVGEGALNVMQVMNLENRGSAVVDPRPDGLRLPLPDGAVALEIPTADRGKVVPTPDGEAVRVMAPIAPGQHLVRVFYRLPYSGSALDIRQPLPLPAEAGAVMIMNNSQVRVFGPSVAQVPADGEPLPRQAVVPLRPTDKGGQWELTLADLPHRDQRAAWMAVAIASGIALWGLFAALGAKNARARQRQRREALLTELVALRRSDPKGSATAQRRETLIKELVRLWE